LPGNNIAIPLSYYIDLEMVL